MIACLCLPSLVILNTLLKHAEWLYFDRNNCVLSVFYRYRKFFVWNWELFCDHWLTLTVVAGSLAHLHSEAWTVKIIIISREGMIQVISYSSCRGGPTWWRCQRIFYWTLPPAVRQCLFIWVKVNTIVSSCLIVETAGNWGVNIVVVQRLTSAHPVLLSCWPLATLETAREKHWSPAKITSSEEEINDFQPFQPVCAEHERFISLWR